MASPMPSTHNEIIETMETMVTHMATIHQPYTLESYSRNAYVVCPGTFQAWRETT